MASSLKSLLKARKPLLLPAAHDALCARLIEAAGFKAFSIGGAAVSAVQMATPDIAVQSLGEYVESIHRIRQGADLPVFVDGENGFGDVKCAVRMVRLFERAGIGAVAIEDMALPPRLGRPPVVVEMAEISAKLEAACAARRSDDLMIFGRTDTAYLVGMDEALRRVERYREIGVDGVLVTGVTKIDDMKRLRDAYDGPLAWTIVEGSPLPRLYPDALYEMGFSLIIYPSTLMLRVAKAVQDGLAGIAGGVIDPEPDALSYQALASILGMQDWIRVDADPAAKKPA